jgi:hypothetical protein
MFDVMNALYQQEDELSPGAREYSPDYSIFRSFGRTGATRYTPSMRDDRHGRVFIYSPDAISVEEYDQMREEGQIKAGLCLVKLPIQQADWSINCEDPDISAFCNQVIKPIWPDWIRNMLLGFDFGYSCFEFIWGKEYDMRVTQTQGNSPSSNVRIYPQATVLKKLTHLDPKTIYLLAYRWSGDFAGVRQYVGTGATIPGSKCYLFPNDVEFQEWYGRSLLKSCYPYWQFKKLMLEWTNVYYETYALPIRKGRYPVGKVEMGVDGNGVPVYMDNDDAMMELLEGLRNNGAVALPGNRYEDANYQWDIEFMQSNSSGADQIAYIRYLDLMLLKSMLVPQLALEDTGSGLGSGGVAQTQVDFFFLNEAARMRQIEGCMTNQVLTHLVRYNFGPNAPKASFKFEPISTTLRQGLENVILETLGTGQPVPVADGSGIQIDLKWLAENMGVPIETITKEMMDQQKQEAMQQQQQMMQGQDPNSQGQGDQEVSQGPGTYGGKPWQYGSTSSGGSPSEGGTAAGGYNPDSAGGDNSDTALGERWIKSGDSWVCLTAA